MKKLGFLFTLALIAPSVMADKVNNQYANMTVATAKTGISIDWTANVTNIKQTTASKPDVKKLKQLTEQTNLKINKQLQQRISNIIEDSLEH